MSRFALMEEIEEFTDKVMNLVTPKYGNHWKRRVEALWADVQERGFVEKTDSTKKLYMSKFRKGVREGLVEKEPDEARRKRVEEALMDIIRIDKEILTKLHEDYQARVKAGNADLTLVPEWKGLVEMFRLMLRSDDMELRALALMALTGRRFEEVLKAGEFTLSERRYGGSTVVDRWLVNFSGQLKTKGGPETMHGKTYAIPVLAPAKEIVESFEEMRRSRSGRAWMEASKRQLSTTYNPQFNSRLKDCPAAKFWPKGASLTLKELRAIYAEIAYVSFAPRTTRAPYFSKVLGHSEEDLTTALSYMRYSLNEQGMREGQEEMNRVTMLREQRREEAIAAKSGDQDGDDDIELVEDD